MKDRHPTIMERLVQDQKLKRRLRRAVALIGVFVFFLTTDSLKRTANMIEWGTDEGLVSESPVDAIEGVGGESSSDCFSSDVFSDSADGLTLAAGDLASGEVDVKMELDSEMEDEDLSGDSDTMDVEGAALELGEIDLASATVEGADSFSADDAKGDDLPADDSEGEPGEVQEVQYISKDMVVQILTLDGAALPAGTTAAAHWVADADQRGAYEAMIRNSIGDVEAAILSISLQNGGGQIQVDGSVRVEVELRVPVSVGDGYNFGVVTLAGSGLSVARNYTVDAADSIIKGFGYECSRVGDVAVIWQKPVELDSVDSPSEQPAEQQAEQPVVGQPEPALDLVQAELAQMGATADAFPIVADAAPAEENATLVAEDETPAAGEPAATVENAAPASEDEQTLPAPAETQPGQPATDANAEDMQPADGTGAASAADDVQTDENDGATPAGEPSADVIGGSTPEEEQGDGAETDGEEQGDGAESDGEAQGDGAETDGEEQGDGAETDGDEEQGDGAESDGEAQGDEDKAIFMPGSYETSVNGNTVTLTWPAEAEIPENVVIVVAEIERGTASYDALYNQALAMLPEADEADTQVLHFFDITLYDGETVIEPKAPVSVSVRLDEAVRSEVSAVHYEEDEPVLIDATAEGRTVSFEAESFSTYGLAYTKPAVQVEIPASVNVDLSSVDFMDAATVERDGVSLSVSQLLTGEDDGVTVTGEVDLTASQLLQGVVEASGVEVQGGNITLSDEALNSGNVTMEVKTSEIVNYEKVVTKHKVEINLTGYAGRTEEISDEAGEVTVTAAENNSLPRDASVSISDAVTSVQVTEPDESAQDNTGSVVGEAAYDITITNGSDQAISNPGAMDVTVRPAEEINVYSAVPAGAVVNGVAYTLIRVHGDEQEDIPVQVKQDAEGAIKEFSFTSDRFSEYTLIYTVDFEYVDDQGETHTWSLPGRGVYSIADILTAVDVAGTVESASLVRTDDQGGGANVLYLNDDHTELISEAAFRDTFELTVVVDGKKHTFIVTDDAFPAYDSDTYLNYYDLAKHATGDTGSIHLSVDGQSTTSIDGTQTTQTVKVELGFEMTDQEWLRAIRAKAIADGTTINIEYDLSGLINKHDTLKAIEANGADLMSPSGDKMGSFTIENGHVKMNIDPSKIDENVSTMKGNIPIKVEIDGSTVTYQGNEDYHFPGTSDTLEINWPGTGHPAGSKSVDHNYDIIYPAEPGNEYIYYAYTLTVKGGVGTNDLMLTDYLPSGMELYGSMSISRITTTRQQQSAKTNGLWGEWTDISSSSASSTATAAPASNGAPVDVMGAFSPKTPDTATTPVENGDTRTRSITESIYTITYTGRILKSEARSQIASNDNQPIQLTNHAMWNEENNPFDGGSTTVTIAAGNLNPGTKVIEGVNSDTIQVPTVELLEINGKKYTKLTYIVSINEPIDATSAVLTDVLSEYQQLYNATQAKLLINDVEKGTVSLTASGADENGKGGTITFDLVDALAHLSPAQTFTKNTRYSLKYETLVEYDVDFNKAITNTTYWHINSVYVDGEDRTVTVEPMPYQPVNKYDKRTTYHVVGEGPWEIPWELYTRQHQDAKEVTVTDRFSPDQTVAADSFVIWVGDDSYNVPADASYLHIDQENHTFTIDFDDALKALIPGAVDPAFKANTDYKINYTTYTSRFDDKETAVTEKSENTSVWTFDGTRKDYSDDVVLIKDTYSPGNKLVSTTEGTGGGVWMTDGETWVESIKITDDKIDLSYKITLNQIVDGVTKAELTDTYSDQETVDFSTMKITVDGTEYRVPNDLIQSSGKTFTVDFVQVMRRALNDPDYSLIKNKDYVLTYDTSIPLTDEIKAALKAEENGNVVGLTVPNQQSWSFDGPNGPAETPGNSTEYTFKEKPYNGGDKTVAVFDTQSGDAMTQTEWINNGSMEVVLVDRVDNTLKYEISLTEHRNADSVVLHDTYSAGQTLNASSITVSFQHDGNTVTIPINTSNGLTLGDHRFDIDLTQVLSSQGYAFTPEVTYVIRYETTAEAGNINGGDGHNNTATWTIDGENHEGGSTETHLKPADYVPGTKEVTVREQVGSTPANGTDWRDGDFYPSYEDSQRVHSHVVAEPPYHLDYTIKITEARSVDTALLTDLFYGSADQTLDTGSFTVLLPGQSTPTAIPADFIVEISGGFTLRFTDFLTSLGRTFEKNKQYEIHFTTTTNTVNNILGTGDGADNKADWTLNSVPVDGGHTETHIKKVPFIDKEYYNVTGLTDESQAVKNGSVAFGDLVKHVITVGGPNDDMRSFYLEDYMMNLQHIDTSRGIIVTDANGSVLADLTKNTPDGWNWGTADQTSWDKNKTRIFYIFFPNSYYHSDPLTGPIHITYYAYAASESDFISACGRSTTDVTNTVRSNEAEVTVQYPLTPGGATLEKAALPIEPEKLLRDNVTVSWQVVVTPSAGTSLKGIWVADEPMRFCTTSLQDAIDGVGTHDMTLVQSSVQVKYQNAGDSHAAGDPVPPSMWEATPSSIWVGNGVPAVYAIKFKEDIFEPVVVTFDTNGSGWASYNVGENAYFYNRAVLIDGNTYEHISEPDDATNQYEPNGEILATKEFLADRVNRETGEICWKITVNTTGNVTFQDLFVIEDLIKYAINSEPDNWKSWSSGTELIDYKWNRIEYDSVIIRDSNGNVLNKDDDYIIGSVNTQYYKYGIIFKNSEIQGPVEIEVPMTVNGRNNLPGFADGVTYLYNDVLVGNGVQETKNPTATGKVENYNLTVDKNFTSNSSYPTDPDFNQEVTYEIRVNADKSYLPEGTPILVDVLPAGMEYVPGSLGLQAWGTHASYASDWVQVNNAGSGWADFSVNGRNLSLSFPAGFSFTGTQLYMTYRARLTTTEIQRLKNLGVNTVQVYDNVVTVTQSNIEAHDNVTWEYQWDKGLHKEDVTDAHYEALGFDQAPFVYYKITINPEERMLNGGVELVLTDRIETSMELVLSSVEVKDGNGNSITGAKISYDGITRVLTVRVPDQTYCEVLFYTSIENPTLYEPRTFTNTAVLTGETVFTSTVTQEHTVVNMSGIIEYTVNNGFIIRKVDGNDINNPLSGAEFTLYKAKFPAMNNVDYESDYDANPESYNLHDYVLQGPDPLFTPVVKTTGSEGTVFFENLEMNTLYYWVETKTPGEDYSAGLFAEPQYLILYNKNDGTSYNKAKMLDHLISDANGVIVNSAVQSYVWVATNNKLVNYKVTKLWSDGDNVENLRPDKVWVQLRQNGQNYDDPNTASVNEGLVQIQANNLGNWEYTWFDLPATDGNGDDYIYTAVELTPEEAQAAGMITAEEAEALTEQMEKYTTLYREVTGGMEITNRLRDETTLLIHKDWNDQNNINYLRPGSIQVYLWRVTDGDMNTKVCVGPKSASDNTIEVKSEDTPITLTAKDGWEAEFTGLVKVDGEHVYTYYLTEAPVDGYTPSYDITYEGGGTANADYIIHFTNELDEVRVTKTWATGVDTSKIESITYAVSRSIEGHEDAEFNARKTSTVRIAKAAGSASANLTEVLYSENNSWGYTWQNLDASGSVSYTPEGASEVTVVGSYQYAVEETGFVYDGKTFKVESSDGGYTVKEVNTATSQEAISHEWHVSREGNAFTNTPKVTITGTKTWYTTMAHDDPTLKLTRTVNSVTETATVVNEEIAWVETPASGAELYQPTWDGGNYTYSGLPVCDSDNNEYSYAVRETGFKVKVGETEYTYTVADNGAVSCEDKNAPKFAYSASGDDLVNTEVMDLIVRKVWKLNGNTVAGTLKTSGGDDITSISFELWQKVVGDAEHPDGTQYGGTGKTYDVTEADDWTTTISDLPKYISDNGTLRVCSYYLKEVQDDQLAQYNSTIEITGTTTTAVGPANPLSDTADVTITNSLFTVVLPATGDMGTSWIYAAGAGLVLLALLGMALRKKRSDGAGIR